MPRPVIVRRCRPAFFVPVLALPPPLVHAALASAAGTALEAVPFVVAGLLLRPSRLRLLAALGSCGCGALPGALSLSAFALCCFSFGPPVAIARTLAAAGAFALFRGRDRASAQADPVAELQAIGIGAFLAALAGEALRSIAHGSTSLESGLAFAVGIAVGLLNPCATGAVAAAAGFHTTSLAASAGILVTAGILPRSRPAPAGLHDARLVYALLGCACAVAVANGPAGFVHPRLLPAIALAAAVCFVLTVRNARDLRSNASPMLPVALLAALHAGSPLPQTSLDATNLAGAYPGAIVHFIGAASKSGLHTVLLRYAITCCRADASPVALSTERPLPIRDGEWVEARGVLVREGDGALVLRIQRWRPVPLPSDPFIYR